MQNIFIQMLKKFRDTSWVRIMSQQLMKKMPIIMSQGYVPYQLHNGLLLFQRNFKQIGIVILRGQGWTSNLQFTTSMLLKIRIQQKLGRGQCGIQIYDIQGNLINFHEGLFWHILCAHFLSPGPAHRGMPFKITLIFSTTASTRSHFILSLYFTSAASYHAHFHSASYFSFTPKKHLSLSASFTISCFNTPSPRCHQRVHCM